MDARREGAAEATARSRGLGRARKGGQPREAPPSRLTKLIPPDLDVLITDVRPGAYRLELAPGNIALLQLDDELHLVEVGEDAVFRPDPWVMARTGEGA